jgi:hypothetical protein
MDTERGNMADKSDRDLLEEILTSVAGMKSDISHVCQDITGIKKDIYGDGQPGIKQDVGTLKAKVGLIIGIGAMIAAAAITGAVGAIWALIKGE